MQALSEPRERRSVDVKGTTYEITAWLEEDKRDKEVSTEELDLIQATNLLRVKAGFKVFGATGRAALWIRVLSHSEPAMLQVYIQRTLCMHAVLTRVYRSSRSSGCASGRDGGRVYYHSEPLNGRGKS